MLALKPFCTDIFNTPKCKIEIHEYKDWLHLESFNPRMICASMNNYLLAHYPLLQNQPFTVLKGCLRFVTISGHSPNFLVLSNPTHLLGMYGSEGLPHDWHDTKRVAISIANVSISIVNVSIIITDVTIIITNVTIIITNVSIITTIILTCTSIMMKLQF